MEKTLTLFQDYLAAHNLKDTAQRRLIVEVFLQSEGHLTAEDLYNEVKKQDSSIGQATVYRTLKLLCNSGVAREVHFGDGVARYEHHPEDCHHDHLICQACGKNIEVVDDRIEELQVSLAKQYGFILTYHHMYLYGICADCRHARHRR